MTATTIEDRIALPRSPRSMTGRRLLGTRRRSLIVLIPFGGVTLLAVVHGELVSVRVSAWVFAATVLALVTMSRQAPTLVRLLPGCLTSVFVTWRVWRHRPYGFIDPRGDEAALLTWSVVEIGAVAVVALWVARRGCSHRLLTACGLVVVAGLVAARLVPRDPVGVQLFLGVLCAAPVAAATVLGRYLAARARAGELALSEARQRMSRSLALDLHDFVAHDLAGIAVDAQAAAVTGGADAASSLDRIATAATRAMATLDRSISVLIDASGGRTHPHRLSDLGGLVDRFGRRVDLCMRIEDFSRIPPLVEATAYRVVVEGLNNVRRHAPDSAATVVSVAEQPGGLRISVRNDRTGSPLVASWRRRSPAASSRSSGLGLASLQDRVVALGGSLHAGATEHGRWWSLDAMIPFS